MRLKRRVAGSLRVICWCGCASVICNLRPRSTTRQPSATDSDAPVGSRVRASLRSPSLLRRLRRRLPAPGLGKWAQGCLQVDGQEPTAERQLRVEVAQQRWLRHGLIARWWRRTGKGGGGGGRGYRHPGPCRRGCRQQQQQQQDNVWSGPWQGKRRAEEKETSPRRKRPLQPPALQVAPAGCSSIWPINCWNRSNCRCQQCTRPPRSSNTDHPRTPQLRGKPAIRTGFQDNMAPMPTV